MSARLEKTRTPGIFKRGSRYVFSYRVDGKQHWESCRTIDEARRLKAARTTDIERGEFEPRSRATLHEYALEWVERYQGRGRRGFREGTRADYRRQIEQYICRYFPARLRLTEITPSKIAGFVAWLCDEQAQKRLLSDATVRNIMAPLRTCLTTAVREGLIRSNPARDVDLPHRPTVEDMEDDEAKAMSRDELAEMLALVPAQWHLFFWFLAATGVRISEAIALQWRHLALDAPVPHVKVRRALVKGRMGPPKSRYGRREIPLDPLLATALHEHHVATDWPGDEEPRISSGQRIAAHAEQRLSASTPTRSAGCRPSVGRLPRFPSHLRLHPVRGRPQRRSGPALARPPLGRVHARNLRPPARRRPRGATDDSSGCPQ
jgi:integrase